MPTFPRRMPDRTADADAPAPLFHRFFAAAGVALMLLLTVAAASPALHQWLHGESAPDASDNCAVVLFASGVTLAAAVIAVAAPRIAWSEVRAHAVAEIFLVSPRYLRQPERGPPVR